MCRYKESYRYLNSLYSRTIISGFSVPHLFVCIFMLCLRQVLLCVQFHIVSSTFFVLLSRWPHHVAQSSHFRLTHFVLIYHFFHIPVRILQGWLTQGLSQANLWPSFQGNPQCVSFFEIGGAKIWLVMVGLCYCSLVEFLLLTFMWHFARQATSFRRLWSSSTEDTTSAGKLRLIPGW